MTEPKRTRPITVGIRLAPEEIEALEREAKRRKWTFSQCCRERMLKGLTIGEPSRVEDEMAKAVGQ